VVFNGPARILTKQNDNQLDRYIYIAVASGPDITSKEEGRVVWLWKDCDESAHVDSAQDAGLKKTTKMVRYFTMEPDVKLIVTNNRSTTVQRQNSSCSRVTSLTSICSTCK
jgi:hypothetical protein